MSLVNVKDPSEFMQCPYDKSHVVSAIRYTRHIVKCQRNHPSVELVACPFNHQHRVRQEDNAKHLATCPDRVSVVRDFFGSEVSGGNVTVPIYFTQVTADEDWDNVPEGPGYNPAEKMNKLQFHNPATTAHLKPAEKRAYRQQLQTRGFGQDDFIGEESKNGEDEMKLVPLLKQAHVAERIVDPSRCRPASAAAAAAPMAAPTASRSGLVESSELVRERSVLNKMCQPSSSSGIVRGIGRGYRKAD